MIRLNANGNVSTHHLRSVLDSRDKDMVLSKFPLHVTKACVLSISRTLLRRDPYVALWKLDFTSPDTWETVLIRGEVVASKFSRASLNFRAHS